MLNVTRDVTIVYSGGAETDVVYKQNASMPSGDLGRTWCNDAVTDYRCDQEYIEVAGANPSAKVVCHETGHAVGLSHGSDANPAQSDNASVLGCMQTPVENFVNPLLGQHNASEINQTY